VADVRVQRDEGPPGEANRGTAPPAPYSAIGRRAWPVSSEAPREAGRLRCWWAGVCAVNCETAVCSAFGVSPLATPPARGIRVESAICSVYKPR
jgi:hypothetical protein